jgi:L-asparaginase
VVGLYHSQVNQAKARLILTLRIAGAGAGCLSTSFNYAVETILNHDNMPVAQSMRNTSGELPLSDVSSQTAMHSTSGYLDPEKSGILLGLLLA